MIWRHLIRKPRPVSPAPAAQDRPEPPPSTRSPHDERRLAGLMRQRQAILFDIEQGESAASPDNPWAVRIALLGDAIGTVTTDLAADSAVTPGPWHPVPPSPVMIERLEAGDLATVVLDVAGERFAYAEEPDWAERGHQIARPELTCRSGDATPLVPPDTPGELRVPLREHLASSLLVLVTDLRDRSLEGETLPDAITLADLARPCPTCGGWTDWRGTCQACAQRQAAINRLRREESRLFDERNGEIEQRHKLVEGLPLARRRLKDIDTEISRVTGQAPPNSPSPGV